jgi:hypothetical protein
MVKHAHFVQEITGGRRSVNQSIRYDTLKTIHDYWKAENVITPVQMMVKTQRTNPLAA